MPHGRNRALGRRWPKSPMPFAELTLHGEVLSSHVDAYRGRWPDWCVPFYEAARSWNEDAPAPEALFTQELEDLFDTGDFGPDSDIE